MPDPSPTARTLGQNIRAARLAAGMTQRALTKAIGNTGNLLPHEGDSYISRVENDRHEPELTTIHRMADALKVGFTDLVPSLKGGQWEPSTLRQQREMKDISQLALAHALGYVGPNAGAYISRVESGQHQPRLSTLQRMADALGIPVDVLLLGAEKPKNGKGKK